MPLRVIYSKNTFAKLEENVVNAIGVYSPNLFVLAKTLEGEIGQGNKYMYADNILLLD